MSYKLNNIEAAAAHPVHFNNKNSVLLVRSWKLPIRNKISEVDAANSVTNAVLLIIDSIFSAIHTIDICCNSSQFILICEELCVDYSN